MPDNWSSFIEDIVSWALTNASLLIVFAFIFYKAHKGLKIKCLPKDTKQP